MSHSVRRKGRSTRPRPPDAPVSSKRWNGRWRTARAGLICWSALYDVVQARRMQAPSTACADRRMTSPAPLALDAPNLTEQVVAALQHARAGRRIRRAARSCRAKASSSPPTTSAARSSGKRSRSFARAGWWRRAAASERSPATPGPAETAFPVPPRRPGDAGRGAGAAGAAHQPRDRGRGAGRQARPRRRRSSACGRCSRRSRRPPRPAGTPPTRISSSTSPSPKRRATTSSPICSATSAARSFRARASTARRPRTRNEATTCAP